MKNEEGCTCGVPNEIHHNTACGWEYACIPFLPFEKLSYPMTIEDKKERWMKWTAFWHSVNTPVTRNNITGGRKVIDNEGNIGTIKHYDEKLHNVFVEYDGGGSGLYCLNEGCKEPHEVNGHKFEIEQYDPLYYFG